MVELECSRRDFIYSSMKDIKVSKSPYELFLISKDDKQILLAALISYYNTLRKRRARYLKGKKSSVDEEDVKIQKRHTIKEPKLIPVCKNIENIEIGAFVRAISNIPKNANILLILNECSKNIEKDLQKEMSKKLRQNLSDMEDEPEERSEDEEKSEDDE